MLNEVTAASIKIEFHHKLAMADFDTKVLTFTNMINDTNVNVAFDLCVGADGSYSTVRRQLMRVTR